MKVLALSLSLMLPLALGAAILSLVVPRMRLYSIERLAIAYLVGLASVSWCWLLLRPFYRVIEPVWILSLLSILTVVAARKPLSRDWPDRTGGDVFHRSDLALLVLLGVEVAVLFAAAFHTPLGWDGVFNFEMKARMLFENQPRGQLPLDYLSDLSRQWSHPQYPLMVPFAEFWVYSWLRSVDQTAIKILFPIFYGSLVALASSCVARETSRRAGLWTALALGALPPLTLLPGASSGYADVPLAAALVGSAAFLHRGFRTGEPESFRIAGILGAVAAWTKTEGLLISVAVGLLALGAAWWWRVSSTARPQKLSVAAQVLWIPIVCLAPWMAIQHSYGIAGADFTTVSVQSLGASIGKVPLIVTSFARELLRPGHWALVWPCWIAAGLLAMSQRDVPRSDVFLFAIVAVSLALYIGVFTFSAWASVTEHIGWALPRLLVPLAPIALMSTALTISRTLRGAEG